jgi:glycosyltransferase involved in cell wall biosynthesis
MLRILQLNPVPTPFRSEFAKALLALDDVAVSHVYFPFPLLANRGRHWLNGLDRSVCFSGAPGDESGLEYRPFSQLLTEGQYTVALSSLSLLQRQSSELVAELGRFGIPVIHWAEQPVPCNAIKRLLKDRLYRRRFQQINLRAVFAIGDRAVEQYRRMTTAQVFLIPYYQDLSESMSKPEPAVKSEVCFLFSGQLIARNNIRALVTAGSILCKRGIDRFHILFFGDGPERLFLEKMMDQCGFIRLQPDAPSTWNNRLKPIDESHVLLTPGLHSGWGLTIPEALAAGRPVISTSLIESARYYVRDGINGFLCDPSPVSIADRMQIFIEQPAIIAEMSPACRWSAQSGDASRGAHVVCRILEHLFQNHERLREVSTVL